MELFIVKSIAFLALFIVLCLPMVVLLSYVGHRIRYGKLPIYTIITEWCDADNKMNYSVYRKSPYWHKAFSVVNYRHKSSAYDHLARIKESQIEKDKKPEVIETLDLNKL
jgi:hypothetical protein